MSTKSTKPEPSLRILYRLFFSVFVAVRWLQEKKDKHPYFWSIATGLIAVGLTLWIAFAFGLLSVPPPNWLASYVTSFWYSTIIKAALGLVIGLFITIALKLVFPVLLYTPQALAMKNLGLIEVRTDEDASFKLMNHYSRYHTLGKPVRVICISGRHLFRERGGSRHVYEPPLKKFADEGRLEVLMPVSDWQNQTVAARYDTYSNRFRVETGIATPEDFLQEMDLGKEYLVEKKNKLWEHSVLCMWRVVLFDKHCIVQNYFPNPYGEYSFAAPTFVFARYVGALQKEEEYSYYGTFSKMFELIRDGSRPSEPRVVVKPLADKPATSDKSQQALPRNPFIFRMPDGTEVGIARDKNEFRKMLKKVPLACFDFHAARGDYAAWMVYYGEPDLGAKLLGLHGGPEAVRTKIAELIESEDPCETVTIGLADDITSDEVGRLVKALSILQEATTGQQVEVEGVQIGSVRNKSLKEAVLDNR